MIVYRTAADVRAIPARQWEVWVTNDAPLIGFSCERWTQRTLREIVRATKNRMGV